MRRWQRSERERVVSRQGVDGEGRRENEEKRANGTRADRVAKTTGSQVIIKCNQYFTYFSRRSEGCHPCIPLQVSAQDLPSFLPRPNVA